MARLTVTRIRVTGFVASRHTLRPALQAYKLLSSEVKGLRAGRSRTATFGASTLSRMWSKWTPAPGRACAGHSPPAGCRQSRSLCRGQAESARTMVCIINEIAAEESWLLVLDLSLTRSAARLHGSRAPRTEATTAIRVMVPRERPRPHHFRRGTEARRDEAITRPHPASARTRNTGCARVWSRAIERTVSPLWASKCCVSGLVCRCVSVS